MKFLLKNLSNVEEAINAQAKKPARRGLYGFDV